MKKKILGIAIVAVALTAGWNVMQNKSEVELLDIALQNVEALASGESGKGYAYKYPRIECFGCPTTYVCGGGDGLHQC